LIVTRPQAIPGASGLGDPEGQATVYAAFQSVVERFGKKPFLRAPPEATCGYADGAIEFTYAAARREVERLRAGYAAFELVPGDRVALAFDSRLDVYLHLLAVNSLGASVVPLTMAGSDDELRYVIDHSNASLVTGADEHLDRLLTLTATEEKMIPVVASESLRRNGLTAGPVGGPRTEAALLYTSGTTGKPKGCMLSNHYFLNLGQRYLDLGGLCALGEDERLLTPLPPNHMNALACSFMAMMLCGGCVIQLDRFHPQSWWRTVRTEAATVIHYLGVMPAILLTLDPGGDEDSGSQVRFGFGAGCDPRHQQAFEDRFGFPLIEAWAMTETGGGAMIVANTEPRLLGQRCIGKPQGPMSYRIVDESDQDVVQGQEGELIVRANGDDPRKGFFSGYHNDDEATEAGWQGGWWHTGDIVREAPDGSLFFVDRRKNVIRRSGENIAAAEVEAALLELSVIGNCAVTAVPDEIRGDEVFAFVVTASGVEPSETLARQIVERSLQQLSYFKVPAYIVFVDELPLTASQKVSRAALKKLARDSIESGRAFDLRACKHPRGMRR